MMDGSSSAYLSLTAFERILLDCIVTAAISVCIQQNLSKLVKVLYGHFNIEDGRIYATFSVYYALFQERCIISRKVKMQLKCKK